MEYILVEFTKGIKQKAYQVIIDHVCIGYFNEDGTVLIPPDVNECFVVDENPTMPAWAGKIEIPCPICGKAWDKKLVEII